MAESVGTRPLGVCLACGEPLELQPERNELTGRQLRRNGEPVFRAVCVARCGYSYRPKPRRPRR